MTNEYSRLLAGTELMPLDRSLEFEARLAESSRLAFRIAYGVLRNREDAEDIAQEAVTRAYRNYARLRKRDSFRAWLVRVTWRLSIDHYRAQKRRTAVETILSGNGSTKTAADVLAARERSDRLWMAIDALPEKLRIVTILAGIKEHDIREVSFLLDLPEGTVKSRLFLARQRLKELLQ